MTDKSSTESGAMKDKFSWITGEMVWLAVMFVLCGVGAVWLIRTIPVVSELPQGTTPLEYVVNVAVARFGGPVVGLLFASALMTGLGHNKGDGHSGLDFAAKVCSFGAATFSLFVVVVGFYVGVIPGA